MSSILQKNERKQFDLRYHSSKVKFFVRFLGGLKKPKRHFEINWPFQREFDKSQLSFKMLFVFVVLQKWSTPPKPPAPAPAPVFSGLLNIVAPVVAGLLVLGIGCLMCLVIMVRKKRSLHGTYNPQSQENKNPRCDWTEMDVFKKPAEERLIWAISVSVTKISSPCQIHSAKLNFRIRRLTYFLNSDLTTIYDGTLSPMCHNIFRMISTYKQVHTYIEKSFFCFFRLHKLLSETYLSSIQLSNSEIHKHMT